MRLRNVCARGTTLVELLVATAFLGYCVSVMVAGVATAHRQADIARNRAIGMSLAENAVAKIRDDASDSDLSVGTVTQTLSNTGILTDVTMTEAITLVSGTADLFQVVVSVTWVVITNLADYTDQAVIETLVRAPDA
ncbi:MAG: hypothetical protein IH851_05350 [Armatimonadetes bacterium]|nr:hypothetical protein [Armatimonadota bacterium]